MKQPMPEIRLGPLDRVLSVFSPRMIEAMQWQIIIPMFCEPIWRWFWLETRAGFATLRQQITKRGYDPKKVIAEWAEYAQIANALDLIFDSDPRKVIRPGGVQPRDPTDPNSGEPAPTPPPTEP